MPTYLKLVIISLLLVNSSATYLSKPDWGFFGHKKINRMAVFTLPQEMIGFYKKNIEYITRESVAPDKRRYRLPVEGVRHFIDLDHFEYEDFEDFPRELERAIAFNSNIYAVNEDKDSILLMRTNQFAAIDSGFMTNEKIEIQIKDFLVWNSTLMKYGQREEYSYSFDANNLPHWIEIKPRRDFKELVIVDKFSEYGVAPYYLEYVYNSLVSAFRKLDGKKILWLSADLGHYLSDIHVPLHTTENYNGAMTDQVGIHAFWESRLPELYADISYDFMVGKAEYVSDKSDFIWNTIFESHRLVGEVLAIEKRLSSEFPDDQQYCYEERNNRTVRLECEEYAQAYHDGMNGMVEQRMQTSILAVGSFWFSAWVAAGQPDLSGITEDLNMFAEVKKQQENDKAIESSKIKVRQHNN